jgi:hypothetical protein
VNKKIGIALGLAAVLVAVQVQAQTPAQQKTPPPPRPVTNLRIVSGPAAPVVEITNPPENGAVARVGKTQLRARIPNLPSNYEVYWRTGVRADVLKDVADGTMSSWHQMDMIGDDGFAADVLLADLRGEKFVVFVKPTGPANTGSIRFSEVRKFTVTDK